MSRKIVSLILMPCVLLIQSVTFGHSHGGNQPAGHSLRPHIHVSHPSEDGIHHHCPNDHNHSDEHHSDHEKQNSTQFESPFDHDSSAVYLSNTDMTVGSRSTFESGMVDLLQWAPLGWDSVCVFLQNTAMRQYDFQCAPPDSESPLFIRHHAYLI
ncbi:hypothetical protein [Gimesia aquarii]|uniref:Uncharacterized protein n=1 Tax=Gimesia aquarii TaxID=2527964 RepID=A0A517X2W7_9PLAN|nr:hypothetical protein [Gimesia aquarii]QDU11844.1 hypothetical protein V202x_52690 [Gimesia aquarii]